MSVPGIVRSALDGEEIAARVSLGGEDELFVTSQRTIIYRAEGLLSDESTDEYSHDADRLTLSEGRRKTKFALEYALEGAREFTIPASKTESVLHPVLAGVLNGNGITDPGESVVKTYRFSELTLIVTSDRLVKHIGEAVWDGDFEQYHYDDVTNLSFEDGSIATQIVIEVAGRPHRIKAPNDDAGDVSERLKRALFTYHDVTSLEELNDAVGVDEEDSEPDDPATAFGEGVDPLEANPPEPDDRVGDTDSNRTGESATRDPLEATHDPLEATSEAATDSAVASGSAATATATSGANGGRSATVADATADSDADSPTDTDARHSPTAVDASPETDGFEDSGFEPATTADRELVERLESLEETVAEQNELLTRQQETIEQLIAELRQGR